MWRLLKKLLGILALLMGLSICAWFIYNQFAPTPQFKRNYTSLFQLAVPIAMIWVGWHWLKAQPVEHRSRYPHFVFARILDPVAAIERGRKYADPLHEALEQHEFGMVSGGGTEMTEDGKIAWVGLDIELADLGKALEFTRNRLRELGAPSGSVLEYQSDGKDLVLPISTLSS
jgi:hypothetical protein